MIAEHEGHLEMIRALADALGMEERASDDRSAEFAGETGWKLRVASDPREANSFDFWLVRERDGARFAVWLLMMAFERADGAAMPPATLATEIDFVRDVLWPKLDEFPRYEREYDLLNEIE